ncbi:MAG TPA: hypothetical protein VGM63_10830 [Mucilaginibacter sp.]|jgi:glycosyltransferase involved in cell wall biosynthesis
MELKKPKKIVMITSGQPSLNPRLVKEADALAGAGYDVTVLYAYWNDWGTIFDKKLIPTKKWKAICAGGDPHQKKLTYFFSRLIHGFAKWISRQSNGKYLAELAISRASYFLSREAKKHEADIYLGHNLGALPATVKAAKTNKKPCGFDAEDMHRYEISDNKADYDVILKSALEDRYFPEVDYLTASSPLIAREYQQLFPDKNPVVVLNVFPRDNNIKQPIKNDGTTIKLFWFSQTIGSHRGVEDVLAALKLLNDNSFELHLLGYLTEEISSLIIEYKNSVNVCVHQPVAPDDMIKFASQFDIGLATENAVPLNRDICLTNKIFTCMQAGLAIVASDTIAQSELFYKYSSIGKTYKNGDINALAEALLYYQQNRDKLFETRKAAFDIANEQLNWEAESKRFLDLVDQTLNNH